MNIAEITSLLAVIVSVITALSFWFRGKGERKKLEAEATQIIGESWKGLNAELERRITELEAKTKAQEYQIADLLQAIQNKNEIIDKQEARIQELENEVEKLQSQLDQLKSRSRRRQ